MSLAPATILLVEDDPNDVFFLQYAFEEVGIKNPLHRLEDGQQAIDYLSGVGQYADRSRFPLPYLALLDLMLPKLTGLDVLRWISQQPHLNTIVVVILSSSKEPADVEQAYRLGARSYLVKPASVHERLKIAKAIKLYWLELNIQPLQTFVPAPPESI